MRNTLVRLGLGKQLDKIGIFDNKWLRHFTQILSFVTFFSFIFCSLLGIISNIYFFYLSPDEKYTLYNWIINPEFFILSPEESKFIYKKNLRIILLSSLFIWFLSNFLNLLNKNKEDIQDCFSKLLFIILILSFFISINLFYTLILFFTVWFIFNFYSFGKKFKTLNRKIIITRNFKSYLATNKFVKSKYSFLGFNNIKHPYKNFSAYKNFKKENSILLEQIYINNKNINFLVPLKSIFYFLSFNILFLIFSLNLFNQVFYNGNNLLHNNEVSIFNNALKNICITNKERAKFFNVNCYYDKYSKNIKNEEMLYLSAIDDIGGILDFTNIKYVIRSLKDYTDKDIVFLYQKTFEGLKAKNEKLKKQKYYNHKNHFHSIGDYFIKNEQKYYNISKKINSSDFVSYINSRESNSFFSNYLIVDSKDLNKTISMNDIYNIHDLYILNKNNQIKNKSNDYSLFLYFLFFKNNNLYYFLKSLI